MPSGTSVQAVNACAGVTVGFGLLQCAFAGAPQTADFSRRARESFHVGRCHAGPWTCAVRRRHWLYLCVRAALNGRLSRCSKISQRNTAMMFDYTLAGLVSAGL